mgnify:FL=1
MQKEAVELKHMIFFKSFSSCKGMTFDPDSAKFPVDLFVSKERFAAAATLFP